MLQIQSFRQQVGEICRRHGIEACWIFGSARTGELKNESDVDLIIRFFKDEGDYFSRFMDAKSEFEKLFGRTVDLLVEDAILNPFFKDEVEKTRELLYAA